MEQTSPSLAPIVVLQGNQSLTLDNPDWGWWVEAGSLAIFAHPQHQGQAAARQYLFTISAQEMLWGFPIPADNAPNQLIALALEPTTLKPLTLNDLQPFNLCPNGTDLPQSPPLIQTWSDRLSQFFTQAQIPFPDLLEASWQSEDDLHSALQTLHHNFLLALQQWQAQQLLQDRQHFLDRQRLNQQVRINALGELASVLHPRAKEQHQEGDLLLLAAGAVGHAMGIQIHPPARSENLDRCKHPLDAIARASRIRTRRVLLTSDWWQHYSGPLLAYKDADQSPVALLPVSGDRYELFDPAIRRRIPITAAIAKQIDPAAHLFYRSLPDQAVDGLQLIQFALQGQEKAILTLLTVSLLGIILGMLIPPATAIIIDHAVPDADRGLLLQIGGGLLATSFGIAIFQLLQSLTILRLQAIADTTSQAGLWDRLMKLELSFFRQYSSGDLLLRVSAINQIRERLGGSVIRTVLTSLLAVINLGIMAFYSLQLAGVALGLGLISIVITRTSAHFTTRKLRPLQVLEGKISGLMVQLIGGVSKLRVAGAEERAFAVWSHFYTQKLKLLLSTQRIEDGVNTFNKVLPLLSSILMFLTTALIIRDKLKQGEIPLSTGQYLGFSAAFGIFIKGITELSTTLIDILDISILWERAQPILTAQPEVSPAKTHPGKLRGKVILDRVTFRYRSDGPLTLNQVTIKAQAGEFIALVGPSGSGKSTLVRLLLGFEVPEEGTVYYDGQDLKGLDLNAVRRQLGVVLQNGRIQSNSIFQNIIGGQLATLDEAWTAAEMAGFAADIHSMPMGMHTVISEGGTNLSGGQRQRLLISRALVSQPKILIFDEATSALDNQTQAIVMRSLEQLQVTRITIAHRLSTIRNADRIYVLESGQVVQEGTFDELANTPGLFAQLITRQTVGAKP